MNASPESLSSADKAQPELPTPRKAVAFNALTTMEEVAGFTRFVASRFQQDRCLQIAGSLTFTTLLALVPLFTIIVTLLSAFPVFENFMVQVKIFLLTNLVPDVAGKIITVYMEEFANNAAKLSAMGIVFLIVTAIALMSTIDRAFNSIWRVVRPRPLVTSLLVYWAIISLGPVFIGLSVSIKVYLEALTRGAIEAVPFAQWFTLRVSPVLISAVAFFFFYRLVPNRFVPRGHALIGALIAAIAFELMKHGLAMYVRGVPTYDVVYGAFASVPIFLLWLFLAWTVILLGAEVTASLSHWHGGLWRRGDTPEGRFHDALRVVQTFCRAHADGRVVTLQQLREQIPIASESVEDTLDRLLDEGIVERTASRAYVMVRNPATLVVADIFRLFVLNNRPLDEASYVELSPKLARLANERDLGMRMTLADAFADLEPTGSVNMPLA
jgi:membrane protein